MFSLCKWRTLLSLDKANSLLVFHGKALLKSCKRSFLYLTQLRKIYNFHIKRSKLYILLHIVACIRFTRSIVKWSNICICSIPDVYHNNNKGKQRVEKHWKFIDNRAPLQWHHGKFPSLRHRQFKFFIVLFAIAG